VALYPKHIGGRKSDVLEKPNNNERENPNDSGT
jgi:hypothetical protein